MAALIVPSGCASQHDEALLRQMAEIRKEISDYRDSEDPSSANTASHRHDDLLPLPSETSLPIVKLRPNGRHYSGAAPVARALQPREELLRQRSEKRSIALPQDELPLIVHQTLQEFDNVRESSREHRERPNPSDHFVTYRSLDALGPRGAPAQHVNSEPIAVARRATTSRPPSVQAATIPIQEATTLDDALDIESEITFRTTLPYQPDSLILPTPSIRTPDEGPTAMYQQGMAALNADRHELASQAFRSILENYPEHGLSDNALYWLGESHYDRSMFNQALPLFQDVLTKYPLGNKVPDAMVKVALCFHNLGKLNQAHSILQQVIEIYPQSEAASVAATRLPKLAATIGDMK